MIKKQDLNKGKNMSILMKKRTRKILFFLGIILFF